MADEKQANQAAAAANASEQQFRIQKIFLKDVSFESPQAPKVFVNNSKEQPQVSLHLNTESTKLENDLYECVLTVTVTFKIGEDTAYLTEVKQAGLFFAKGFPDAQLAQMLGSFCPNILFPYAREAVGSLVQKGGFPQLSLEPVNFDALYAQHREQNKQNAPAPDTAQ